jgi:hypothetical protein
MIERAARRRSAANQLAGRATSLAMSFIAEARIDIDVPPETAFDVLLQHPKWPDWMPRSFEVPSPADSPLHVGKRFRVRIARAPFASTIEVTVVNRPGEITWCGGRRGLLYAEHRFLFSSDGNGGTRVHSHETWSGALAPLLRPLLQPGAERVGSQQLAGLAAACRAVAEASAGAYLSSHP